MFIREWKCRCPKDTEQEFLAYLIETGVNDTQAIEGCDSYQILTREFDNEIEFTLQTFWQSLESIKEYAGENLYHAVLYPDDDKYHITPDLQVKIYRQASSNFGI